MALSFRLKSVCLPNFMIFARNSSTLPNVSVEKHRKISGEDVSTKHQQVAPNDYKYVYPEFMPSTTWQHRDRISEKLERRDMYRRRAIITIPEFYVGSIMAVTVADSYAPGKTNRFVGLCIMRTGVGLRSSFTLRNVIDGLGIEILYQMYSPTIQKIDVLKLQKRLDDELLFLRDAPNSYSEIPFDFDAVPHPPGAPVPVNTIKVKLNKRPWHQRWERFELQGVEPLDDYITDKMKLQREARKKPWEKYDLMKKYRSSINEFDEKNVMGEVYDELKPKKK